MTLDEYIQTLPLPKMHTTIKGQDHEIQMTPALWKRALRFAVGVETRIKADLPKRERHEHIARVEIVAIEVE